MSSEIRITGSLQVTKGNLKFQKSNVQLSADMAGDSAYNATVSVGTSAATLTLPSEIATAGMFMMRNTGTNNIEIGLGTGTNFAGFLKLKSGEFSVGRLDTNTIAGKAAGAATPLDIMVIED